MLRLSYFFGLTGCFVLLMECFIVWCKDFGRYSFAASREVLAESKVIETNQGKGIETNQGKGIETNQGKGIETNQIIMYQPPSWVSVSRVQSITDEIQKFLEWEIRKIKVYWYVDTAQFSKIHGFGSWASAITRKSDQTVHMGPSVTTKNFDGIFGHELVHIIVSQKYKTAIPEWLEEGLANYAARHGTVDYKYLASQPNVDVLKLTHPIRGDHHLHYLASTGLMEMFADKCSISDLLQLSVGKKLETYLKTYCEIQDVNASFHRWVQDKLEGKQKKKRWWEKRK